MTRKFGGSRGAKFAGQEVPNLRPNDTDYSDTDNSQSQSQSQTGLDATFSHDTEAIKTKASAPILVMHRQTEAKSKLNLEQYNMYLNIIQENIEYENFTYQDHDKALVDNIVQVMLDVILTESPMTVRIGQEIKSREIVKSIYLKLGYDHIQHVVEQYKAQHHQITFKTAYLRTMLYTIYQEMDAFYTNQVRADGVVW